MMLLLLEALGAALILIGIIWWTMFSGRENGELPHAHDAHDARDGQNPPLPSAASHEAVSARTPDHLHKK